MKISKTTINMAARRGVSIRKRAKVKECLAYRHSSYSVGSLPELTTLEIRRLWGDEPSEDVDATYKITGDGLRLIGSSVRGWPELIQDDKHLRRLLPDICMTVITGGRWGFDRAGQ